MEEFDIVIIGSGPAGVAAAVKAEEMGARFALIDGDDKRAPCAHIGALPIKCFMREGEIAHLARDKNLRSVRGSRCAGPNFAQALREAREVADSLKRRNFDEPLNRLKGCSRFEGRAVFKESHAIDVNGRKIAGKKFLITTGASARIPEIRGLEQAGYITYGGIMQLEEAPASLTIIGAGPQGIEFAQMFSHFGTKVRIIQAGRQILSRIEPELAAAVTGILEEDGIAVCTGERVQFVEKDKDGKRVTVKAAGGEKKYRAAEILMAVGQAPNTAGLGLEEIGVKLGRHGEINISDEFVTELPHIYAAGDVCGEPMLLSVAIMEGKMAVANALGNERKQIDYDAVPSCTFSHPEVGQVGLTEEEARNRGHQVESRTLRLDAVSRMQIMRDRHGIIKMVADRDTGRILGCAVLADRAGDLANEAAIAIKNRMSVNQIAETIFAYPTMSESLTLVAAEFAKPAAVAPIIVIKERKAA